MLVLKLNHVSKKGLLDSFNYQHDKSDELSVSVPNHKTIFTP